MTADQASAAARPHPPAPGPDRACRPARLRQRRRARSPRSSSPAPTTSPPVPASASSSSASPSPTRTRPGAPAIPAELIGTDAAALVARDDVDVVVEVIGGLHPAHELVETALRNGKPVVTANKALLAVAGAELAEVAAAAGVRPALRGGRGRRHPRRSGPCASRWRASRSSASWGSSTARPTTSSPAWRRRATATTTSCARRRSSDWPSATRRPTSRATTRRPRRPSWPRSPSAATSSTPTCTARASAAISAADVAYASRLGYSVKLLAIAELIDGGPEVSVRVHPAMVPKTHPLAVGARRLQRRVRRGRGERRAHALRARRRRRPHRQRHARRSGRRVAQPPRRRAGPGAQAHQHDASARRTTCARPST